MAALDTPGVVTGGTPAGKTPVRAAVAAFLGSLVEFYDFFIFGTAAALVFPRVFFPSTSAAAATVLSLATFGVAFAARPIGAIILGHFGDRVGRRSILLFTVLAMGISTILIGVLPGYAQIGWLAPVLLVVLRLVQGFAAGGEQGGANSLALEHAPDHRRGFFTSWTLNGNNGAALIAVVAFLPFVGLPRAELDAWGWRIPFLASAVVVGVAFFVRRGIEEPPDFEQVKKQGKRPRVPLFTLLAHSTPSVVRVVLMAVSTVVATVFSVVVLTVTAALHPELQSAALLTVVITYAISLVTSPLFGGLSDRIGRKPVFIAGMVISAVMTPVLFRFITVGSVPGMVASAVVMFAIGYSATTSTWPAFYAEQFPTPVRYSGIAVGTTFGGVVAGFAPTIITAAGGAAGATGWAVVSGVTGGACLIAIVAAALTPETAHLPTARLGLPATPELEVPRAEVAVP